VIQARNRQEASSIRRYLTNAPWERSERLCPGRNGDKGRHGEDNGNFVEAVRWRNRTGASWRDMPDDLGNWNSRCRRFRRWSKKGVWERIFHELRERPDHEYLSIDATIVRGHGLAEMNVNRP
jgi:putative transposase